MVKGTLKLLVLTTLEVALKTFKKSAIIVSSMPDTKYVTSKLQAKKEKKLCHTSNLLDQLKKLLYHVALQSIPNKTKHAVKIIRNPN